MEKSNLTNTNQSDELDLGLLFNALRRGVSSLFNFIFGFIKGILQFLLSLLVFFHQKRIFYIAAVIIGGFLGFLYDKFNADVYQGKMVVEPNFGSARQLYSNIDYYNSLINEGDSLQLSKIFKVAPSKTLDLVEISIMPIVSETKKLSQFNEFVQTLDSTVVEQFSFKDFIDGVDPIDYETHEIEVSSKDKTIFPLLEQPILAAIAENNYFKDKQDVTLRNLKLNDSLTLESLRETDSLRIVLQNVLLIEANKMTAGTNIVMSETKESNKEIALLDRKLTLQSILEDNNRETIESQEILRIISEFPSVGTINRSLITTDEVKGSFVGLSLLSLYFLFISLGKYLTKLQKET